MPSLEAPMLSGGRLALDVVAVDIVEVMLGQRRRLAARLAELGPDDWSAPSRCARWNVADVVAHLTDTSRWVVDRLAAPTEGAPPWRFDAEVTPHEFVLTHRGRDRADLLDDLAAGTERLGDVLRHRVEPLLWMGFANYPPPLAAAHLLWDSWTHERDVFAPQHGEIVGDAGELEVAAGYGLLLASLRGLEGTVAVDLFSPGASSMRFEIRPGDGVAVVHVPAADSEADVEGDAADVIDALAGRAEVSEVPTGSTDAVAALGRMSAAWRSRAGDALR